MVQIEGKMHGKRDTSCLTSCLQHAGDFVCRGVMASIAEPVFGGRAVTSVVLTWGKDRKVV